MIDNNRRMCVSVGNAIVMRYDNEQLVHTHKAQGKSQTVNTHRMRIINHMRAECTCMRARTWLRIARTPIATANTALNTAALR